MTYACYLACCGLASSGHKVNTFFIGLADFVYGLLPFRWQEFKKGTVHLLGRGKS